MTLRVSDDLNRADNASLGANWTTVTGESAPEIHTNEARAFVAAGGSGSRYSADTPPADQYAEVLIGSVVSTTTDEGVGPSCRIASGAMTHYFAQTNTHETRLFKFVAGTPAQLGSDGVPCASGDLLRLICNGTSISVTKNGATIIGPVTDSAIASGGYGIWCSDAGGQGTINTWFGGDLVVIGATNEVDVGSRRNRPGRGPYSLGKFFRPRADAFTQLNQTYSVSLAEAATATDVVSALTIYPSSLTEAATAADILSALAQFIGTLSEAATATDVITSLMVATAALTEATSVADQIASALIGVAALSEAATATDQITSGNTTYNVSVAETGAASDTISSSMIAVGALSESATAADAVSSVAIFARALAEAVTATETISSTGAVYSMAINEAESLGDQLAAALQGVATLNEVVTAADQVSALQILSGTMADAVAAVDTLSNVGSFTISVVEAAAAADFISIISRNLPPRSRVFSVPIRSRVLVIQANGKKSIN